jgi:hypothetical protein
MKISLHFFKILIVIDPIVPQEFGFTDKEKLGNSLTEFMSDMSSDSSNESDNMI